MQPLKYRLRASAIRLAIHSLSVAAWRRWWCLAGGIIPVPRVVGRAAVCLGGGRRCGAGAADHAGDLQCRQNAPPSDDEDFTVIGLLQVAALAYGLWTVFVARPVHLVFEYHRMAVVLLA